MSRRWLRGVAIVGAAIAAASSLVIVARERGYLVAPGEPFPINQRYVAVALNGQRIDNKSVVLTLGQDSRGHVVGAYAGCNQFGVVVKFLTGGQYVFGESHMTAMGCGAASDFEKLYFDALLRTKHWRIAEGKLILAGPGDVLQFEPEKKEEID